MVSIKALGVLTLGDLWREVPPGSQAAPRSSKLPTRARAGKGTLQRDWHRACGATPGPYWTTRVPVMVAGWMSQRKK